MAVENIVYIINSTTNSGKIRTSAMSGYFHFKEKNIEGVILHFYSGAERLRESMQVIKKEQA
jgi:hypothetical protein